MRPLILFYILVFYILIQFTWWAYLLVNLNTEVYQSKIDFIKSKQPQTEVHIQEEKNLEKEMHRRWMMVAGEGIVFLSLLIIGITYTRQSFNKEIQLARQQKNFMMSITHEFKSPLAAIKLALQTLQKRRVEEAMQQQLLQRALFETDRVNSLVENILMAARIEAANLDFTFSEFSLSEAVKSYVNMSEHALKENKKLVYDIEDGLHIHADPLAIASLFMNLLENADKYSPPDTTISIKLFKKDNSAHLEVADNGPGVAEAEKRKIFEKFYRVGNEEIRKTKGTGLGLYIARFIAIHHHAKISVRSNSPKGSIFEVVFPLINSKV